MTIWTIEPRDPLIVRDGKPIGGDASIETLPFLFPSTTAGAVRARMASPNGEFLFPNQDAALKELQNIPVAGPILTEVDAVTGTPTQFFLPAPKDAVVFPDKRDAKGNVETVCVQRLEPGYLGNGGQMDSLGTRSASIIDDKSARRKRMRGVPSSRASG